MATDDDDGKEVGQAKALRETDLALLVRIDGKREMWIPKSQIHDDSECYEHGTEGKLIVKTWFYEKEFE